MDENVQLWLLKKQETFARSHRHVVGRVLGRHPSKLKISRLRQPVRLFLDSMVKLLKQILNDEGQDLKRLALILFLLVSGAMASRYLAHYLLPGVGLPHFTVRASH